MSDSNVDLPPLPDSATVAQVAGIVRHVLTALAGMGILAGFTVSNSTLTIVCSAGLWLAAVGWSLWQKYRSNQVTKAFALHRAG